MPPVTLRQADPRTRLAAALRRALAGANGADAAAVRRVEVPADDVAPLAWLAAQPATAKRYWHGRDDGVTLATAGEADIVEADSLDALEAELAPRLASLPERARYLGAVRFEPSAAPATEWAGFGRACFVLPRVELRVEGDRATLAVHLTPDDVCRPDAALAAVAALAAPATSFAGDGASGAPPVVSLPRLLSREDTPDRAGWVGNVERALAAFARGEASKVVLARRARLTFEGALDPLALLARLQAATPGCFHLLVPAADGGAFVAATPERLFRQEGDRVWTEALAGTRPRGAGAAADQDLRDALLASEKDRREHAFVREDLAARLAPLTTALFSDGEPRALTLARGRHLLALLDGTLRPGVSAFDLLQALHPTPAVGGTPREAALRFIAGAEGFDRGLYAGPVGWVGRGAAEFAVGIRSGLVRGAEVSLYSGAGIVRGSEPAAEWAEVEHKVGDFARVLGLA